MFEILRGHEASFCLYDDKGVNAMSRVATLQDRTPAEKIPTASPIRYHYMDNLRALALLAGIFFHAALAYSPVMSDIWLTADSSWSLVLDAGAWFSHLFRIPLFFLIAGFFTCYLVEKRGVMGFLKNRTVRILIPLVLFLPMVFITIGQSVTWALQHTEHLSSILTLIAAREAPEPPMTTHHLWFLYVLCQFYVAYSVLHHLKLLSMRWASMLHSARFLVFVLPVLLIPVLFTQLAPHPAPDQFIPQWWSFGFFGPFFLVGSRIFKHQDAIDALKPYALWLLVESLGLYAVYYNNMPKSLGLETALHQGVKMSWSHLGISTLEAVIAVHMTLVCLVAGKTFINRASAAVRFIADSSYWIYIIHLPVLIFIQFLLLDANWNLFIKFGVASFGTLAIGLSTYCLFVRWTPIGRLLNGKRRPVLAGLVCDAETTAKAAKPLKG